MSFLFQFSGLEYGTRTLLNVFTDPYDGTYTWTQTGTTITVNSGVSGKIAWITSNGSGSGVYRRVVRDLGENLNDAIWTIDWEVVQSLLTTPNYFPVTITSAATGIQESDSDVIGTNLAATDKAVILYGETVAGLAVSAGTITAGTLSTTYYYRLVRESATLVKLFIYSDAARTTEIAGSPISQTIASTITGLRYIHHEIHESVTVQSVSANGDNLTVYDGVAKA